MKTVLFLAVVIAVITTVFCATRTQIANQAKSKIGSRVWLYSGDHVTGSNTNKCNIFVADVLKAVGAHAPDRHPWIPFVYAPIGANEWADSHSAFLTDDNCWDICTGSKTIGDVIAAHGHVGIVTGASLTTSASAVASPPGLIVENDWGFRGENPTCWRWSC